MTVNQMIEVLQAIPASDRVNRVSICGSKIPLLNDVVNYFTLDWADVGDGILLFFNDEDDPYKKPVMPDWCEGCELYDKRLWDAHSVFRCHYANKCHDAYKKGIERGAKTAAIERVLVIDHEPEEEEE